MRSVLLSVLKTLVLCLLGLAIGLLIGGTASAQELIKNPSLVVFTPMDYALVDRFEGGYFQVLVTPAGGCDATTIPAAPIQLEDLQKPGLQPNGDVQQVLISRPALGCFVYKARAWAGLLVSPWSDASLPFQLTPLQQGRPIMR